MKKRISVFLATLIFFSFTACDSSNSSSSSVDASKESSTVVSSENVSDAIRFESFVAVDNDECSITIKDIEPNNMWGYTLSVSLENKSADKTYMFSVEDATVNDVHADPLFATEVAPGKKSNDSISFSDTTLKEYDVTDFTDIELYFRVYDSNDWSADAVVRESVHVYPYGEDKAVKFERKSNATDAVLVDNDDVTVIITGFEDDDIWGYTANLYLINKTDNSVMFSVDEASVNGYMADPFFAKSVRPGKYAFTSMSWSDSTLEENDITEVEEIEFKLRAYNDENWTGNDIINEVFTIKP